MGTKATGLTMAAFYNDVNFWGDRFHDDVLFIIDGVKSQEMIVESLNPQSVVEIECGYAVDGDGSTEDLSAFFTRWEKLQTHVSLVVTIDKIKEEAIRGFILAAGGTIA
jgi:hypothetical protein